MTAHLPPHDLDAEGVVLSSLLLLPHTIDDLAPLLRPEDFYADSNRQIFEAITGIWEAGKTPDLVSVSGWLREKQWLEGCGGSAYIAQIADATPAIAQAVDHAKRLGELASLRRLASECAYVRASCLSGSVGDVSSFLASAEKRISEASSPPISVKDTLTTAEDAAKGLINQVESGVELPPQPGAGFRLKSVKRMWGDTPFGELLIVAGRPGSGKTSLAVQGATENAFDGVGSGVLSFEMNITQLTGKAICQLAKVDSSAFTKGKMTAAERQRFVKGGKTLNNIPLMFDEKVLPTISDVRRMARRMARAMREKFSRPLRFLVVDHFHKMNHQSQLHGGETQAMNASVMGFCALAREIECTVVLLSQLNRGSESRSNKDPRPKVSDLKGCGGLEENAYMALLIYREEVHDPTTENRGMCEIIGGKVRLGGATGSVKVRFHGPTQTFEDLQSYIDPDEFSDNIQDGFY